MSSISELIYKSNFDSDVEWYAQYGRPQQADFYPSLRKKRAKVARELIKKGYDLKLFNIPPAKRPKGYGNANNEYAYMWGLGGVLVKPNLPK